MKLDVQASGFPSIFKKVCYSLTRRGEVMNLAGGNKMGRLHRTKLSLLQGPVTMLGCTCVTKSELHMAVSPFLKRNVGTNLSWIFRTTHERGKSNWMETDRVFLSSPWSMMVLWRRWWQRLQWLPFWFSERGEQRSKRCPQSSQDGRWSIFLGLGALLGRGLHSCRIWKENRKRLKDLHAVPLTCKHVSYKCLCAHTAL